MITEKKFYVSGNGTGELQALPVICLPGKRPLQLAEINFGDFQERLVVRKKEVWDELQLYLLKTDQAPTFVSFSMSAQLYADRNGNVKKSLAIWKMLEKQTGFIGITAQFRGKITEILTNNDKEYLKLDCSSNGFPCFFYVTDGPVFMDLDEGDVIHGGGVINEAEIVVPGLPEAEKLLVVESKWVYPE